MKSRKLGDGDFSLSLADGKIFLGIGGSKYGIGVEDKGAILEKGMVRWFYIEIYIYVYIYK